MFIIKNSYISHCGKKPPPAHCELGILVYVLKGNMQWMQKGNKYTYNNLNTAGQAKYNNYSAGD